MKILYIETHFILAHARGEQPATETVLHAAERDLLKLALPVFCVYEALQKHRRDTPEREQWASRLDELARNLEHKKLDTDKGEAFRRSAGDLRKLNDTWQRGLDQTLNRLLRIATLLPLSRAVVDRARLVAPHLRKEDGDPWHIAAVLEDQSTLEQADEVIFLSGDKEVRAFVESRGIEAVAAAEKVVAKWSLEKD
ncbi:MAG: hypothetical protein IPJ65_14670 [Archangiaceae bacterium]|nr:hypothetical protein [Archangiaceae bacterium]